MDSFQGYRVYTTTVFYLQHTLPLSILSHHLLLHDSLKTLQERLGYSFNETQLLQRAMTHPSTTTSSFMVAEVALRNSLSNCGLRTPFFLGAASSRGSKGMKDLIEAVKVEGEGDEAQRLLNNEQLEFLGDAVLEYICR